MVKIITDHKKKTIKNIDKNRKVKMKIVENINEIDIKL